MLVGGSGSVKKIYLLLVLNGHMVNFGNLAKRDQSIMLKGREMIFFISP
jgi:hypothetical protein